MCRRGDCIGKKGYRRYSSSFFSVPTKQRDFLQAELLNVRQRLLTHRNSLPAASLSRLDLLRLSNWSSDTNFVTVALLPHEILLTIFNLLCQNERTVFLAHRRPVMLNLSHVCREWRHVSLFNGILWSRISTRLSRPEGRSYLAMCLKRSLSSPLRLHLDLGKLLSTTPPHFKEVLTMIKTQLGRVISLAITGSFSEPMAQLLALLLESGAPVNFTLALSLRRPVLAQHALSNEPGRLPVIQAPAGLASVSTLSLEDVILPFRGPIHLPQLRHLRLTTTSSQGGSLHSHLAPLLRGCLHLQTLYISGPLAHPSHSNNMQFALHSTTPVELPSLKLLRMDKLTWWDTGVLFHVIRPFQLESLHLSAAADDLLVNNSAQDSRIYESILGFLRRLEGDNLICNRSHSSSIRFLSLDNFTNRAIRTGRLISILELLPQLRRLHMRSAFLEEELFVQLSQQSRGKPPILCPRLEHISVTTQINSVYNAIIQSKRTSTSPIPMQFTYFLICMSVVTLRIGAPHGPLQSIHLCDMFSTRSRWIYEWVGPDQAHLHSSKLNVILPYYWRC